MIPPTASMFYPQGLGDDAPGKDEGMLAELLGLPGPSMDLAASLWPPYDTFNIAANPGEVLQHISDPQVSIDSKLIG